jgi:hypothetical protein
LAEERRPGIAHRVRALLGSLFRRKTRGRAAADAVPIDHASESIPALGQIGDRLDQAPAPSDFNEPPGQRAKARVPDSRERLLDPSLTTFPGGPEGDVVDLVIGLDFGTSCCKVVIRSPFMARGRAMAIPFEKLSHDSSIYLIPTEISEAPDGTMWLVAHATARRERVPKMELLADVLSPDAANSAVCYLALLLRESRGWFLSSQCEEYRGFTPRWALNIGIPSAGYDDEIVRERFGSVARAAWIVSLESSPPTRSRAAEALATEVSSAPNPVQIGVIPEIAAETVGYARSPMRESGLHLIVDVGASTMDVCGFILHKNEDDDQYTLLHAVVERLGCLELQIRRLTAIGRGDADATRAIDPLSQIAVNGVDLVGHESRDLRVKILEVEKEFVGACSASVGTVLRYLRTKGDPNAAAWSRGLPVFLCGGGATIPVFERAIAAASDNLEKGTTTKGLVRKRLPTPADLANQGLPEQQFLRLAVAYGLSFDSFDIGRIVPQSRTPPMLPKRRREQADMITKDQV